MAEPARQLSDRENAVALRLVKQESRDNIGQGADSGSNIASLNDHRAQKGQAGPAPDVRQARAKARQDMDPRNKITNIDDYQTQRGQVGPGAEREGLPNNSQPAGGMSGEADQAKERPNPFQSASVDPALLRQQQEEQKGAEQADQPEKEGEQPSQAGGEEGDAAKLNEKKQAKREALAKKAQKMMAPDKVDVFGKTIQMGTNRALRWGWYTLIPSWGLSLLYIDLHIMLRWIFGEQFFCKLGQEWIPPQAKTATGGAGKEAGKMIGIIEVSVVLGLNLLAFFLILSALGLTSIIVQFATSSLWEKVKAIWTFREEVWGSVSALYDLLKGSF